MRRALLRTGLVLAMALAGCLREPAPLPPVGEASEAASILVQANRGPVALVLLPHPITEQTVPAGLHRALLDAYAGVPLSAAVFHETERERALRWLVGEIRHRRRNGRTPRLVLAGHAAGATAAGEIARHVLRREPAAVVELLLTVDAVKSTAVGATTGVAGTLLTLNNPLPGQTAHFVAWSDTPPVDGRRLLQHVNYYQTETGLAHGARIRSASENHHVTSTPGEAVNHGNIDDFAYPLLRADLATALRHARRRDLHEEGRLP
jgi:hypothetical protein